MISGINVTPLVDITLVLLIVFMVTASYIVRATIDVDLPKAANGGEAVGEMLAVVLKAPDAAAPRAPCTYLEVNGEPMQEAGLRKAIAVVLRKDAKAKALISASKDCTHGEVIRLIDVAKGEGISQFAFNIERDAPTP
jgi:biopolymer transport protein TolR